MGALIPVRDDLGLFEGYHSPQVAVDVRLNTNESPLPPPPGWLDALHEAVDAIPFHRYPDRSFAALRTGLAELHGVRPDQVFAANGSNEVLQTLLLTYGGAGRSAAVFEPTYALHSHIAQVTGTTVATGERNPDFTLDLDVVERVLTDAQPSLTFLCSPNNPTGRVEPREVVETVLDLAPGLLVVDEAYGQFSRWSALEVITDDTPLVVVRTFSKTWSMAATRLGYCIAPAPVVRALEQVVLPYHLDAMKQAAGALALRFKPEMEARVALLNEERGKIAAALGDLPVDTWPSDANFILFRPQAKDGDEVWQALVDRSVLVRNCTSWPRLTGCLRVTVGTPEENERFLAALTEVLA
ncbi:MAG TPA: histidinol-phosphate transaminase [Acidimicrobiales bacterium]|jgi:histidinol-phosphate aminotransferase|nr:histidinol-phosphate transaminase [Acidimicrobiales bacterium]